LKTNEKNNEKTKLYAIGYMEDEFDLTNDLINNINEKKCQGLCKFVVIVNISHGISSQL